MLKLWPNNRRRLWNRITREGTRYPAWWMGPVSAGIVNHSPALLSHLNRTTMQYFMGQFNALTIWSPNKRLQSKCIDYKLVTKSRIPLIWSFSMSSTSSPSVSSTSAWSDLPNSPSSRKTRVPFLHPSVLSPVNPSRSKVLLNLSQEESIHSSSACEILVYSSIDRTLLSSE